MPIDQYAASRSAVNDLVSACIEVSSAHHRVFEVLHRSGNEGEFMTAAVAARIVALITKGTEVPTFKNQPTVLGGDGRRIRFYLRNEESSLTAGWGAQLEYEHAEEYALVVFRRLVPVAVHIFDIERCSLIDSELSVSTGAIAIGSHPVPDSFCLSILFHYNVLLEPLKAAALGIRTFLIDPSNEVGWTRLEVSAV